MRAPLRQALLEELVAAYPAQPATAYWRAIELDTVIQRGMPDGFGLDLGCGDGKLTEIVFRNIGHRSFVGVDIDPLEAEGARRYSFYERVHAISGAVIPENDATFDFVFSNSVLEHIPDLQPVLCEVSRLLRRGGQFIFTVPSAGFRSHLRGSLLPWVQRECYLRKLDRRLAHFHYLSIAEWTAMLHRNGMRVLEVCPYMMPSEVRRWETLHRFTGGLLSAVTSNSLRPIEIQRRMGLRQLQSRYQLPSSIARIFAKVISIDPVFANASNAPSSSMENQVGCLMVRAMRS